MLYKFAGQESEINLDYADKEFLEYKWAELAELPGDVGSFQKKCISKRCPENLHHTLRGSIQAVTLPSSKYRCSSVDH